MDQIHAPLGPVFVVNPVDALVVAGHTADERACKWSQISDRDRAELIVTELAPVDLRPASRPLDPIIAESDAPEALLMVLLQGSTMRLSGPVEIASDAPVRIAVIRG